MMTPGLAATLSVATVPIAELHLLIDPAQDVVGHVP
jgi:hypothetical protein